MRRADGAGTKVTKVTKFTKNNIVVFEIFVTFVIFVPLPSARLRIGKFRLKAETTGSDEPAARLSAA